MSNWFICYNNIMHLFRMEDCCHAFDEWKSAAIENYRISYKGLWQNMFQQIHSKDYDHHMWLLGPSSYIFNKRAPLGHRHQFRFPWIADSLGDLLAEDLSKLDVIMLTHEHSDHLDYSLLSLLRMHLLSG